METVGWNKTAIQQHIKNRLKEDEILDQMTIKEYCDPFTGEEYSKRDNTGNPLTGSQKPKAKNNPLRDSLK